MSLFIVRVGNWGGVLVVWMIEGVVVDWIGWCV